MGSVRLPQRQLHRSRCRPGPARPSSPLPRPPLPGRMRLRSARVGFGCVVAAERSCEARESEPGGEGWSLHGGEPEEPPPLPTPPPQPPPPPPPPRRPPPGADGLVRSRRGGTRTSGRQHTAQHGPGNQAPLGGQLTGECAGREDHRAFQTVSDTRPGAALSPRAPLPTPARCRPLPVRGTGEGTRARPTDRCGGRAAAWPPLCPRRGVGPRRSGPAPTLSLPNKEAAVARPQRSRRREGVLRLASRRWGRVLARRCPGSVRLSRPTRPNRAAPEPRGPEPQPPPHNPRPGPHPSPAAAPAPRPADAWICLT